MELNISATRLSVSTPLNIFEISRVARADRASRSHSEKSHGVISQRINQYMVAEFS